VLPALLAGEDERDGMNMGEDERDIVGRVGLKNASCEVGMRIV